MGQLSVKDLTSIQYLTPEDIFKIFNKADELKRLRENGHSHRLLEERTICIICEKPSLRTRVSYEVAMTQLGGHAITLKAIPGWEHSDVHLKESDKDLAYILEGYVDAIVARTFSYDKIEKMAGAISIPVINGLSNLLHPVKMLADLYTMLVHKGRLEGLNVTYVGDSGNNMAHSLILGATKLGVNLTIASPGHDKYRPDPRFWRIGEQESRMRGCRLEIMADPKTAVKDADIIYTDVWISMGMEKEKELRLAAFQGYEVNWELIDCAPDDALIMHPLPRTGYEMKDDVAFHPRTIMFKQAHLKLHVEKAILVLLLT